MRSNHQDLTNFLNHSNLRLYKNLQIHLLNYVYSLYDVRKKEFIDEDLFRDILAKNETTIHLLQRGVACSFYQAPLMFDDELFAEVNSFLNMGKMLNLKVLYELEHGEYESAVESCVLLLRYADKQLSRPEVLTSYLVGVALQRVGLERAGELLHESKLSDEQIARVSKVLNELGPFDEGLAHALKNEY